MDAAVAQAARDVSLPGCRRRPRPSRPRTTPYMALIPNGPAKDAGKAAGMAAAAGMLAWRSDDRFDDVVPYVQAPVGPGVFEPIAPTPPVDTKLPYVRPFTYRRRPTTGRMPRTRRAWTSGWAKRPRCRAAPTRGRPGGAGVRSRGQRRPDAGADGDRSVPHGADVLPVQPHSS